MNRKTKTGLLRLKLSCGALRFNTARLWGVENAVKDRDERRKKRAALDSIFNAMPPSVFFYLDTAVVVIDRMTGARIFNRDNTNVKKRPKRRTAEGGCATRSLPK